MVLVVDDDPDIRETLADVLECAGVEAATAASAYEAIDALVERPPELVLLDVMMPGMSGPQLFETMQRHAELAAIPVCFLTASPCLVRHTGARVLAKPVEVEVLLDVVRQYTLPPLCARSGTMR